MKNNKLSWKKFWKAMGIWQLIATLINLYNLLVTKKKVDKLTGRDTFKYGDEYEMEILGHKVLYNPIMMGKAAVAGVTPSIFGNEEKIYVDKIFLSLSENTKKFVVAHELGHLVNGHMKGSLVKLIMLNSFRGFVCSLNPATQREFEADRYALHFLSKEDCISALKELSTIKLGVVAKLEFILRIREMERRVWE